MSRKKKMRRRRRKRERKREKDIRHIGVFTLRLYSCIAKYEYITD